MALHSPKDSVTLRDLLHLTIAFVPATGDDRGVSPLELCTSPFSKASHSVSGAFGDQGCQMNFISFLLATFGATR